VLIAVAAASGIYGAGFMATGPRSWLFRSWAVIPLESPVAQIISAVCLGIAGGGFIWLGYKALMHQSGK
jgi:hypothetical protein